MNELEGYISLKRVLPKNIDIISHEIALGSLIEQIKNSEFVFENSGKNSSFSNSIYKKSIIIENILLNIPLPILYVDTTNDNKYRPIDIFGYELLKTIQSFINNEFKLTRLDFLTRLNNHEYEILPEFDKRTLFGRVISFRALTARMPKIDKYVVIYRVSGRNALLKAHNFEPNLIIFYNEIHKLIENDIFKNIKLTNINNFISSFIALFINQNELTKEVNFDYFKNLTLLKINNTDKNLIKLIADKINQSYLFIVENNIDFKKFNHNWLLYLFVIFTNDKYCENVKNNLENFKLKIVELSDDKKYSDVFTIISRIKDLINSYDNKTLHKKLQNT
jgi:hypothetical protein